LAADISVLHNSNANDMRVTQDLNSFGEIVLRVCSICAYIISLLETWLSKVDIYFDVDMFY
jgi:hypothetical protein